MFATYALGAVTLVDNGQYPNLAAREELTSTSSWWENRRVLQKGNSLNLSILSSAQYFYRTITPRSDDALTSMIGYKKSNGSCDEYLIADVYFDDSPLAFYEPVLDVRMHPDTAITVKDDTLRSVWFTIGTTREVSFFGWGTDTSFVKMDLVKRTTGTRTPVVLKPSISTAATLVVQTFTNGGGDEYRLEFYRTTTTANVIEDLHVGQIPYDSLGVLSYGKAGESAGSRTVRGGIVNLAVSAASESAGLHAYVYPNPAQDRVSISVYRTYAENLPVTGNRETEQLLVRVVSMLGTEVARFDARAGDAIDLPVKHLPKGVYFVRVEQAGNPAESGTTSFVIE